MNEEDNLLNSVNFNNSGLVCAVVQDAQSLRVLMVAWMNKEALRKTIDTGYAHYFSRSRQQQWMKGEQSGHTQQVQALRLDCDGDALLLLVKQNGGIACHTGRESCFYRSLENHHWIIIDPVLKSEYEIYFSGAARLNLITIRRRL